MTEKNVLITGASRGIGRSTALLFADKGFHVFLNCHKSIEELQKVQQEIEQNHPNCSTIVTGNVGNSEDVHSIFREIYSHCDSLDVLVNNAGVAHIGLLMDLTDEEWRRIIAQISPRFSTVVGKPSRKWYRQNPVESSTFPPCGEPSARPAKLLIPLPNPVSTVSPAPLQKNLLPVASLSMPLPAALSIQ